MAVFFSGTDNEELTDNAPNYNYYLSLIVNNKNEYCARIAFIGDIEGRTIKFKDRYGVEQIISSPNKQVTFYYEMEIFAESSNLIDDFFVKQYEKVIAAKPVQTFPQFENSYTNSRDISNTYTDMRIDKLEAKLTNKPKQLIKG
jgi:hypothetical protein